MCQGMTGPTIDGRDEWYLDNPTHRAFIHQVRKLRANGLRSEARHGRDRAGLFTALLADPDWLPEHYMVPSETSGMGSGIGMWLLYRSGDGDLAFSSLVVPPGRRLRSMIISPGGLSASIAEHRHEEVFTRTDDGAIDGKADSRGANRRNLNPGDIYELLPETDIHRVRTTSDVTSVSLHLLGNDNGCISRHRFYPEREPGRAIQIRLAECRMRQRCRLVGRPRTMDSISSTRRYRPWQHRPVANLHLPSVTSRAPWQDRPEHRVSNWMTALGFRRAD